MHSRNSTYSLRIFIIFTDIKQLYFNWNIGKDDCGRKERECVGAGVGIGDLRSHNLATSHDSLSVGVVLTFELIDISVGPIF